MTGKIHSLMERAVCGSVFPGGVLLAFKRDRVLFFEAYGFANLFTRRKMARGTVFDLASLTKPLATTLGIMKVMEKWGVGPDSRLGEILPPFRGTEKERITVSQLLRHSSGLPAHRPYYKVLLRRPSLDRRRLLKQFLITEPLKKKPGEETVYSDLGFMILSWIIEHISKMPLNLFLEREIYAPFGLAQNLFFQGTGPVASPRRFAATEVSTLRGGLINGVVHDDNAFAVGGVQGHAGLFGDAMAVCSILERILNAYHGEDTSGILKKESLRRFIRRERNGQRWMGFDYPSLGISSSGSFFSEKSIGHLGFTGTSFWMDLKRRIIIILLTNRVHPSGEINRIKEFRPQIHDAVMDFIL